MSLQFTQEQKDIFDFVSKGSGHGIIDAVAGAGKTTTIMESASYVEEGSSILFCAFNKSIASEIEAKFNIKSMARVVVKTIHALGYNILKLHSRTGNPPSINEKKFSKILLDKKFNEALSDYYRQIYLINHLDPDDTFDKRNIGAITSLTFQINHRLLDMCQKYRATLCKNTFDAFFEMVQHFGIFSSVDQAKSNFKEEVEQYYHILKRLLERGNQFSEKTMIIDFTDMLYLPYAWQLYPTNKYDFVFIDECQDLSKSQFAIALKYCKSTCRVLSVGDPYQSIYGFTGADVRSFDRIRRQTKAKELPLTTCFRCPEKMVTLAKKIRTDIVASKDYDGTLERISFDEVIEKAQPNDLIISRVKAPLLNLVFKFIDIDTKVKIHPDEAKEFINELKNLFKPDERQQRLLNLPSDIDSLKLSVIQREEFKIEKNAERIVDPTERQLHVNSEKRYLHEKMEFIHKKVIQWKESCSNIEDLLNRIWDFITAVDNPIRLSSIHRAKGLEENRVFILDYDSLPLFRLEMPDWQIQQELNLKYVAVTRAKEELFLIEPIDKNKLENEGSLFDEIFSIKD